MMLAISDVVWGQIVGGFITVALAWLAIRREALKVKDEVKAEVKLVQESVAIVPELVRKVDKVVEHTNGMATALGIAKLAQGAAEGELKGRTDKEAEVKADAATAPPVESVAAIIDQYKASELKDDIDKVPKKVVDEIDKKAK